MTVRLLGDIHGMASYLRQAYNHDLDLLIQLGDFGWGSVLDYLNAHPDYKIRFIHGNHERYSVLPEYKQYLGKYGEVPEVPGMFFVSGAWSIDKSVQIMNGVWGEEEELNREELAQALKLYEEVKPKIVISHTAPMEIAKKLISPLFGNKYYGNRTEDCLSAMFEIHQPEQWYFGHWHMGYEETLNGTYFRCLDISEHIDLEIGM